MATKTATHTTETLDTNTVKITCLCKICTERGIAATVRKTYADEHNLSAQTKQAHTEVHNLVLMANSALRNAPQVIANGPWAA
jgi:hypothetical protein